MAQFRYRAIDRTGQLVFGEAQATSGAQLIQRIEELGNLPVEVTEIEDRPGRRLSHWFARGPTKEEITELTQDLAMLLKGGVTLSGALQILSEMTDRAAMRRLLRDLHDRLADGKSLAEALTHHPQAFPPIYVTMVEVAEAAGTLEETLGAIAHERRRNEKLRRRISSALSYPAFLLVAAMGVFAFVLLVVLPEFERALAGYQGHLNPSAQMIFALSGFVRDNTDLILAIGIVVLGGALVTSRSDSAVAAMTRLIRRVPGIRNIATFERTIFFCGTLSLLIRNGVDISTALRLIRELMRDKRSAQAVDDVIAAVRQGERLTEALAEGRILPQYVLQMLRVGEEAGRLGAVAFRVAEFYEEKLDRALERLTGTLGPAIMIVVSVLIAWLIISVITALLSVNELLV